MELIRVISKTLKLLSKKEKSTLKILTVCNIIVSIADIALLIMLLAIVSLYSGNMDNQVVHLLPKSLMQHNALLPVIVFFSLFILKNLSAYSVYERYAKFVFKISSRLSLQEINKYLNSSYEQYTTQEPTRMINLANNTPIEFARHILTGIQIIITEITLLILVVIAILLYNTTLFLLLIAFLLPPILLSYFIVKKKLNKTKNNIREDGLKASQYLSEATNSYIESNIYNKKSFFTNRHYLFQNKLHEHLAQQQIAHWIPSKLVEIFAVLGLFILIIINYQTGNYTNIINLGAFIAAAYKIIPGIVRIANMSAMIRTHEYTINDLSSLNNLSNPEKSLNNNLDLQDIKIQNVTFDINDKKIIKNINAQMSKGDFVWVTAASGRGKTTFVNLIFGFLEPQTGSIFFNKKLLADTERREYRQCFSYVPQKTFLINDTILKNITLSENDVDFNRMTFAIEHSGLEEFVNALPNGLQSILTNSGNNISGGQRQRIAIARALYHQSDVIILDEPFNELDDASETELLQFFKAEAEKGKIVILLSHNSISQKYCNKTIDLER